MTTVYDVPPEMLILKTAEKLKGMEAIKPPEWASYVKTGIHRERVPVEKDWWYTRNAAVLRKVYLKGPIGIEHLRVEYGGRRDAGSKRYHPVKGSGAVIRKAIQQLEAAGLVSTLKGRGRIITPAGQKLLDNTAHEVKLELVSQIPDIGKY